MRIALLNCAHLPDPDPDEAPLLQALRDAGVDAESVAWDGPTHDPGAFDAVVIRATWNYPQHLEAFLAYLEGAAARTRLINGLPLVLRNVHKGYLLRLQADGIDVVPTHLCRRGGPAQLPELGSRAVVIKPAVSAGSWLTRRFEPNDPLAVDFLAEQLRERDMLVQPLVDGFEDPGERSWIFIDGTLLYGVQKRPRFTGQDEEVHPLPDPSDEDRVLAEAALTWMGGRPAFARVDVVDVDGASVVSEVECLEPSLFLDMHRGAADLLAKAIVGRLYP